MKKGGGNFIERTVCKLAGALEHAVASDVSSKKNGLLQGLDPRIKLLGLLAWILTAVSVHKLAVTLAILFAATALALFSRISPWILATRVWLGALVFTGMIALPAIFLTPGTTIGHMPLLHWTVTWQGVHTAPRLLARAETAATLAILLVLTTPWTHVLKALRVFRIPVTVVVILGMTHRYIFLLLHIARDFFEARRCRLVGHLDGPDRRRIAGAGAGVLLEKSLQLSDDAYLAMQARGFRGDVYVLDEFRMRLRDWGALAAFSAVTALALWADGR